MRDLMILRRPMIQIISLVYSNPSLTQTLLLSLELLPAVTPPTLLELCRAWPADAARSDAVSRMVIGLKVHTRVVPVVSREAISLECLRHTGRRSVLRAYSYIQ